MKLDGCHEVLAIRSLYLSGSSVSKAILYTIIPGWVDMYHNLPRLVAHQVSL